MNDEQDTRLAPTQDWPSQPTVQSPQDTPAIAGYEVIGEIGRGAMGIVYRARQIGLNREVALKMILNADYAGTEQRARFDRESQALAQLRHENVVQVFEVGEVKGKPYFSLELVQGGSLDSYLNGNPRGNDEAAQIVEQLADASHVAHQNGIVHRDLKPANVLMAQVSKSRETSAQSCAEPISLCDLVPKITDFGLAKKLDDSVQTQTGAIMCTPSYAAPEQAQGKQSQVGPATDVYALGAILYELLTGRPPFTGTNAIDVLAQVVEEDPVPPRLLNPKADRDLETICLKCLEKDPRKRYASAQELADDLNRYQTGDSITARSYNLIDRLARTLERGHLDAKFADWGNLLLQFAVVVLLNYAVQFTMIRNNASRLWMMGAYCMMFAALAVLFVRQRKGNVLPSNSSERQLWSIWLSYFIATGTLNVIGTYALDRQWTHEGLAFSFHCVTAGIAFFAMGSQFWGGFYAMGVGFWIIGLLMLLSPGWGPAIHGVTWAAALVLIGLRLRAMSAAATHDEQNQAARS